MAVTIVSRPEGKKATCSKCKCVLQYQFNDMTIRTEKDYTGCGDEVARITCPNCSYRLTVPSTF